MKWYYWLLIAIAGLALYTYGVQGVTSRLKDKAYDARQAAGAEERKREDEKHAADIARADAAEQKVAVLQGQLQDVQKREAEQKLVIAIAGENAEQALQRIKTEEERYAAEKARIGIDVPAIERCNNICATLQRLKLITAAEAAECRADCQR